MVGKMFARDCGSLVCTMCYIYSYIHVRVHFSASDCLPYGLNSFVFAVLD
jgi:hypothetical protein